ncbi:hypothetical protein D3C79_695230 [compost metagenome]
MLQGLQCFARVLAGQVLGILFAVAHKVRQHGAGVAFSAHGRFQQLHDGRVRQPFGLSRKNQDDRLHRRFVVALGSGTEQAVEGGVHQLPRVVVEPCPAQVLIEPGTLDIQLAGDLLLAPGEEAFQGPVVDPLQHPALATGKGVDLEQFALGVVQHHLPYALLLDHQAQLGTLGRLQQRQGRALFGGQLANRHTRLLAPGVDPLLDQRVGYQRLLQRLALGKRGEEGAEVIVGAIRHVHRGGNTGCRAGQQQKRAEPLPQVRRTALHGLPLSISC